MSGELERIGELLVEEGVVTQEDLLRALAEGGLKGTALGRIVESNPHARRADLAAFLAQGFRVPAVDDLRRIDLTADAAKLVPEEIAQKHELIPIVRSGDVLFIAKANYYNRAAILELRRTTGLKIKVLQADELQVRAAIDLVYKGKRGDLPAPAGAPGTGLRKKDTTLVRSAGTTPSSSGRMDIPTPARGTAIPGGDGPPMEDVDAVPLISPPDNGGLEEVRSGEGDDVIEIMDALRIPSQEYAAALQSPFSRLVVEFDDLFHHGKPAAPTRV